MKYHVFLEPEAINDIQKSIDFYNSKRPKQGVKFEKIITQHLNTLKSNPFFRIRYDKVRCLPIKNYPFLIHFTIDEENRIVKVRSLFHTSKENLNLND
ncbi:MAG: type II toxin-antitoxin system RelE/ParE family toxin [Flavobacteriales bacterium]